MRFDFSVALRAALSRNEGPAFVTSARSHPWSDFRQLHSRIAGVVSRHQGTTAILLPNGLEAICSVAACFAMRRPFVLLNSNQPEHVLAAMMEVANVGLVITTLDALGELTFSVPCYVADTAQYLAQASMAPPDLVLETDLACIVFTSGTTGVPKGVRLKHRGLENFLEWKQDDLLGLGPGDCVLQKTPLHFDVALWEVLLPLATGARLVTGTRNLFRDPVEISHLVQKERVTVINLVPRVLDDLLTLYEGRSARAWSSLRSVLVGGEELPVELMHRFHAVMPGVELVNLYGPTETSIGCTFWRCERGYTGSKVPIGRAVRGLKLHLSPAIADDNLPEVGELIVSGCQIADGYQGSVESTGFLSHVDGEPPMPTDMGAAQKYCAYRTGDLVSRNDDGTFVYLGRVDNQVKVNGVRVELEGIEHVIRGLRGVHDAVVRKETHGGAAVLAAYVERSPGQLEPEPAQEAFGDWIRRQLMALLPASHCPLIVVELTKLPTNDVGKKTRQFDAPSQIATRTFAAPGSRPTGGKHDTALEFLQAHVDRRLTLESNLFEFGVDSIRLVSLLYKLRHEHGLVVAPGEVYRSPAIGTWSFGEAGKAAAPRQFAEKVPVTPQISQIWFLNQLHAQSTAYHAQFILQLLSDVPSIDVCLAIRRMHAETPAYQARFIQDADGLYIVRSAQRAEIQVIQLDDWDWQLIYETFASYVQSVQFNPVAGDTIRWIVFACGNMTRCIAQVEHHFVHDGWSIGLSLVELKRHLAAPLPTRKQAVARRPPDYFDWCQQYAARRATSEFRARVDQYAAAIGNKAQPCSLPGEAENHADLGEIRQFCLHGRIYAGLEHLAGNLGVSLFAVCMAAFQLAVAKVSHSTKYCVGTAYANRPPEHVDTIGMFVNTVVLPVSLDDGEVVLDVIRRTGRTIGEFSAYQDIPLLDLIRTLKPGMERDRNPLFQVMFAFHDSNVPELEFAGAAARLLPVHNGSAKNDLNVVCIPRRQQLREASSRSCAENGSFEILWEQSSRIDKTAADKVLGLFVDHLARWSEHADRNLGRVELGRPAALEGRTADLGSLVDRLQELRDCPDTAVVAPDGRSITYRALWRGVDAVERMLNDAGAAEGTAVLVPVIKSPGAISCVLACLRRGFPMVLCDPAVPARRMEALEAIVKPRIVIEFDPDGEPRIGRVGPAVAVLPPAACYVVFTSGTTGEPRGVVGSLENLSQGVLSRCVEFGEAPHRILVALPLHFDVGLTVTLWALATGSTVLLDDRAHDCRALLERIDRDQVTHVNLVASLYREVLLSAKPGEGESLVRVMLGGESLDELTVQRHRALFPTTELTNEYGPTECSAYVTVKELGRCARPEATRQVTVGRPICNVRLAVRRDPDLEVREDLGRLLIAGPCVTLGYVAGEGYQPHRLVDGCWYDSGDIAGISELGEITLAGRSDRQAKVGGYRVEPAEIESVIREVASVDDAAVVARRSGGGTELCAFIASSHSDLDVVRAVRSHLVASLERQKIPAQIKVMREFPRLSSGKVDRGELLRGATQSEAAPDVRAQNVIRRELVSQGVDVNRSFRENGFDSLDLIRLGHRLRGHGVDIGSLSALYNDDPIEMVLNRITAQSALPSHGRMDIEAWFQSSTIGVKDRFFQFRVWEVDAEASSAIESVRAVLDNVENFLLGPYARTVFQAGRSICQSQVFEDDSRIAGAIDSMIRQLSLEKGVTRLCTHITTGRAQYLAIVIHHLLVDSVSWEYIYEHVQAPLGAARAEVGRTPALEKMQ